MLLVAFAGLMLGSCNDKEEEDPEIQEIIYSDVAVKAFSLEKNDSVLAHLDSVYFAIDLNNAVIYNPDSLPIGTEVEKLVLKITLPTVNSATLIEAAAPGAKAKEIDYINSPKDSVNFTYGDARLKLESYDKKRDTRVCHQGQCPQDGARFSLLEPPCCPPAPCSCGHCHRREGCQARRQGVFTNSRNSG